MWLLACLLLLPGARRIESLLGVAARVGGSESAMVDEFMKHTIAVVGVEATTTDPSQIPRYESLKLTSTSDSVDVSGGRIAAVFALAGAKGNFGLKATAEQPLPDEALSVTP
jgi:hypothetical protein